MSPPRCVYSCTAVRAATSNPMKRVPFAPWALAAMLLAADARALSLQDAAALALQNDPRLRAADAQVAAQAANVDVARAGYFPNASLNVNAGASRYYLPSELSQTFPLPGV